MSELIKAYVAANNNVAAKSLAEDAITKHTSNLLERLATGESETLQGYSDTDACVEALTVVLWSTLNDD